MFILWYFFKIRKGMVIDMKVVICDDNLEDLSELEKLLIKYKEKNAATSFDIYKYTDSTQLYQNITEKNYADIYILDVLMPHKSGIDIGELIRIDQRDSIIIYTTTSEEYALDAYNIHAGRYLIKPLDEDKFNEAMEYALSSISEKKEPDFIMKTNSGLVSIPFSKIEYVENVSRTVCLYLTNKKIVKGLTIRTSFEDHAQELLCNDNFIQVHKSFIVNMEYIEKLSQESLTVVSEVIIPISKKKSQAVKHKYLDYVTKKYKQ